MYLPKAPRLRIGVRGRVRGWGGGKWRRGKAVPGEDAARESAERRAARTRRDAINSRRQIEPWSNATPPTRTSNTSPTPPAHLPARPHTRPPTRTPACAPARPHASHWFDRIAIDFTFIATYLPIVRRRPLKLRKTSRESTENEGDCRPPLSRIWTTLLHTVRKVNLSGHDFTQPPSQPNS